MRRTVGRVNKILDDTHKETPATLESIRKLVQNAEQVSADLAVTTAVVRDGAQSFGWWWTASARP